MRKKGSAVLMAMCLLSMWLLSPVAVPPAEVAVVHAATIQLGDIDQDGDVDMMDAITLFQYNGGAINLPATALTHADMDDNGCVDSMDLLFVYRIAAGESASATVTNPTTTTTRVLYGIDVSYAQGEIDWAKVKKSGVDFAVLRCGYGQDQTDQDDEYWDINTDACEKYDIPYGAYFFCYARTVKEAQGEAKHALRLLKGKNLSLPVFYDMEYSSWQGDLTNEMYAAIATTFCKTLQDAGYDVGVYANVNWWETRLTDPCFDAWYRWVAQYNDECEYEGTYHLWQFSDRGKNSGISGNVDENYAYVDFGLLTEALHED